MSEEPNEGPKRKSATTDGRDKDKERAPRSASHADQIDMTTGPIGGKVFLFALPVAVTAILQQLYNTVDLMFLGQFVGVESMAGVGANAPLIALLIALFQGVSLGANVTIATHTGARDAGGVHRAVHTSILIALIGGVAFAILAEALAVPLLALIAVPVDAMDYALSYLRVFVIGLPVVFLYDFEAAILRSQGDSRSPMMALFVSSALNIVLDLLAVGVFHWGATGAAAATVIAIAASALILFAKLLRSDSPVRVTPRDLHIDRPMLRRILRIGLPAGLQGALFSISNIVVQGAINSLGSTVMAASSAAMSIEVWAYYSINAFGQACTTFVGQNNGARKYPRCRRTLRVCLAECAVVTVVMVSTLLFFGHELLSLFNPDPEVVSVGYVRLMLVMGSYGFSMLIEVMSGYLRGYGLSLGPALVTMGAIVGIRILWVAFVFSLAPSFTLLMAVYPVSLSINTLGIFILFCVVRKRRGILAAEKGLAAAPKLGSVA